MSGYPSTGSTRSPTRKRLTQLVIFLIAKPGLRHCDVGAGTFTALLVYSLAMIAASNMADSDQSVRLQQRPYFTIAIFLAAALSIVGCSVKPTKPTEPAKAAAAQETTPPAAKPMTQVTSTATTEIEAKEEPVDIWTRLRQGYSLQHLKHPRIEWEIDRFKRSPNAFYGLMARGEPYLYDILNRIEAAGLPTELALLPAVESGFRAHAYSPNGAAGLWQFMPATGHMLGLEQNWWIDRRRAIRASTDAAIVYLQKLHKRFDGDWLLALAAYNAGSGKVGRAIKRAERRGDSAEFWDLDLPGETDRYAPRLLALAKIVSNPSAYGLDLPEIQNQIYFKLVATGGQIDLNVAAELAKMPVEDLLILNPAKKRWATAPNGPHELLLPIDKAETFSQALAELPDEKRLRWQRHRIVRGDSLIRIARRYGVTAEAIRQTNGIRGSRIRAGDALMIPLSDSVTLAASSSNRQARQRVRYRVRKGDSLYTIAKRFQVRIADLKRWNSVGRYIHPGQRLNVFIDPDS